MVLIHSHDSIFPTGEIIVIDETMVRWRGRLIFRQYNAGKAAKYGIKLFKLCATNNATIVYTGKSVANASNEPRVCGVAEQVCRDLGENLFNQGRILVVDNF